MKAKFACILFLLACQSAFLFGQQGGSLIIGEKQQSAGVSTFSLHLNPGLEIPIGETAKYFSLGGLGRIDRGVHFYR